MLCLEFVWLALVKDQSPCVSPDHWGTKMWPRGRVVHLKDFILSLESNLERIHIRLNSTGGLKSLGKLQLLICIFCVHCDQYFLNSPLCPVTWLVKYRFELEVSSIF